MPEALHVSFLDETSAAIWLPALDVVDHPWETADFAHAAYLLGRLAGSDAVAELAPLGDADGRNTVRTYADGRLAMQVAPALRSTELWQAPWLADAFDDELRGRLLDTLDRVPAFVDELEAAPAALAHGDACPNNLLHTAGSDDITLIDYGFWSLQCVGFDLGQLLVGDVQIGRRPAATLPELEAACLPAYVEGLARRGRGARRRHGGAGARPAPDGLHRPVHPARRRRPPRAPTPPSWPTRRTSGRPSRGSASTSVETT